MPTLDNHFYLFSYNLKSIHGFGWWIQFTFKELYGDCTHIWISHEFYLNTNSAHNNLEKKYSMFSMYGFFFSFWKRNKFKCIEFLIRSSISISESWCQNINFKELEQYVEWKTEFASGAKLIIQKKSSILLQPNSNQSISFHEFWQSVWTTLY